MPEVVDYRNNLCIKLFNCYDCREFCDAEIRANGRSFQCHKVVLAAASPVLRNIILLEDQHEKAETIVIPMEFLSSKVVDMLLRYFYTGSPCEVINNNPEFDRLLEIFCDTEHPVETLAEVERLYKKTGTFPVEVNGESSLGNVEDFFESNQDDFQLTHEFEDVDNISHENHSTVMYSVEVLQDLENDCDRQSNATMGVKQEMLNNEYNESYVFSNSFQETKNVNIDGLKQKAENSSRNSDVDDFDFVSNFDYFTLAQRPKIKLPRKPPFLCPCENCGKIFESYQKLRSHYRHTHGEKKFKCSLCPLRFLYPKDLKCHMRTHTGEKPFMCEICGRSFAQMGSMTVHRRTHKKEKAKVITYPCTECKKEYCRKEKEVSYAEQYDLSFAGLSSLICPNSNCAKKFSSTKALRKHLKNDVCNQGKLYCLSCNTEFESMVLLHRHVGKVHCTHKKKQRRVKSEGVLDTDNTEINETLCTELDSVIETTVSVDALGLNEADGLLEFCGEVVMESIDD